MQSNTATKFSPIVCNEKKVEVSLVNDQAVIQLSTWAEDLGWCGQKTLTIDADMLDDLHRIIASARYKLKSKKIESNTNSVNILKFPSFL